MMKFHSNECCARGQMEATCSNKKRSKVDVCGNISQKFFVVSGRWCCCVVLLAAKYRKMWYHGVQVLCDKLPIQHIFRRKEADIASTFPAFLSKPDKKRTWVRFVNRRRDWSPTRKVVKTISTRSSRRTIGKLSSAPSSRNPACRAMTTFYFISHFDVYWWWRKKQRKYSKQYQSCYVLGMSRRKSENVKFDDEKSSTWTSFRKGEGGLQNRAKIWTTLSPMRSPFWTWILQNIPDHPCVLLQGRCYQNISMDVCLVRSTRKKRDTKQQDADKLWKNGNEKFKRRKNGNSRKKIDNSLNCWVVHWFFKLLGRGVIPYIFFCWRGRGVCAWVNEKRGKGVLLRKWKNFQLSLFCWRGTQLRKWKYFRSVYFADGGGADE